MNYLRLNCKAFFIFIIIACFSVVAEVQAQICKPPKFIVNDTICPNQVVAFNRVEGYLSTEWDFCVGSLSNDGIVHNLGNIITNLSAIQIREQDGSFIGYALSRSNALVRLDFGRSLDNNSPTTTNLGNPGGLLNGPEDLKIFKQGDVWYGLIVNLPTNNIIRLNWGNSLLNNPVATSLNISGLNVLSAPRGLEIVNDNGNIVAFVVNSTTNTIASINFRNTLQNTISSSDIKISPVLAGASGLSGITAIKTCETWYVFAASNGKIYKILLGDKANNTIQSSNIVDISNTVPFAIGIFNRIKIVYDKKQFHLVVINYSSQFFSLLFNDLKNNAAFKNLSRTSTLGATYCLDIIKERGSWNILTSSFESGNTSKISYSTSCNSNYIKSAENPPQGLTYNIPGKYYVDVKTNDSKGNINYFTDSIVITNTIKSDFTYEKNCINRIVKFTDISCSGSSALAKSWHWNFGDGGTSVLQHPEYKFSSEGTYQVQLVVVDENNNTSSITKPVTIFKKPTPDFSYPPILCSNNPLQFYDNSISKEDTIKSWSWDFGTGFTSSDKNPSYAFPREGNYNIKLTIRGISGCDTSITKSIQVQKGPATDFSYQNLCIGEVTAFKDLTPEPTDDFKLVSRSWDFGDPNSGIDNHSVEKDPTHKYNQPGLYTVTLKVANSIGCETIITKKIRIYELPLANFEYPRQGFVEDVINFIDISEGSNQQITGWTWNFGDGTESRVAGTSTLQNPRYKFPAPGTYTVNLEINTNQGCIQKVSREITLIRKCPVPSFALNREVAAGDTLSFINLSSPDAVKYEWDFCSRDLGNLPIASSGVFLPNTIVTPNHVTMVNDNGEWFGFVLGAGNNTLFRLDFGSKTSNTPIIRDLGNPGGVLSSPREISIIKEANQWYGLVINNANSKLIRIDFGVSLSNVIPKAVDLGNAGVLSLPIGMKVVKDDNNIFVFAFNSSKAIYAISFGSSINNTPLGRIINDEIFQNINGGILSVSFLKDCNTWYGLAIGGNRTFKLDFGISLSSKPFVTDLTTQLDVINGGRDVSLHQDGGRFYAFINTAGVSSNVFRIAFGNSLANAPEKTDEIGNLNVLSNAVSLGLYKDGTEWNGMAINSSTRQLYRIYFIQKCAATFHTSSAYTPANLVYNQPGKYFITLSALNMSGDVSHYTDSINVGPSKTENDICNNSVFSTKETICIQESLILKNLSKNNIVKYEWDFCNANLSDNASIINIDTLFSAVNPLDLSPVFDGVRWVAFAVGTGSNNLYRLDFVNGLEKKPITTDLGNLGLVLNSPNRIKIVKEDNNWFGIVTNSNNNLLIRYNFGASLQNNNPNVTTFSTLNRPADMKLYYDVKDGWFVMISSNLNNNISLISFGSSLINTPQQSIIPASIAMPGTTGLTYIALLKDCNKYFVVAAGSSNRFYHLEFQNSIFTNPIVLDVTNQYFGITNVREIHLFKNGGVVEGLIGYNNSATTGGVFRVRYGAAITSSGFSIQNMTTLSNLVRPNGMQWFKDAGQWQALAIDNTTRRISRIIFANDCNTNVVASSVKEPANVIYTKPGTYNISLKTINSEGIVSTALQQVRVIESAQAAFAVSTNRCAGTTIQFTNQTALPTGVFITSYAWDFGDEAGGATNTSTLASPSYTYSRPGTYTVRFTVRDNAGCSTTSSRTVQIFAKPAADFGVPAQVCSNMPISFRDLTSTAGDAPVAWAWTFGNAGTSTQQHPTFTFPNTGIHTVSLKVTTLSGCDTTVSKQVQVNYGTPAYFTFANSCFGETMAFSTQVDTSRQKVVSVQWNFGDPASGVENTSNLWNPEHRYITTGSYPVTLTLTNEGGCTTVISRQVGIFNKPTASIRTTNRCAGSLTTFAADNLVTEGATTMQWNFGVPGAQVANGPSAAYRYATPGTYTVSLTITTETGCRAVVSQQVEISAPPVADFTMPVACAGQGVQFTDASQAGSGIITNRLWDFGNGQFSTAANPPVQTYNQPGNYQVSLRVNNSSGCVTTIVKTLVVNSLPTVDFTVDAACAGSAYTFRDISMVQGSNISNRVWTVAGNPAGTEAVLQHTFSQPGQYVVTLRSRSNSGCERTVSKTITVGEAPKAAFTVQTPLSPPYITRFTNQSTFASQYRWDFGDGSAINNQVSPQHEYVAAGTFTVTLVAIQGGCSDTLRMPVTIIPQISRSIVINRLEVISQPPFTTVRAELENKGNVTETQVDLVADMGNNIVLRERWTGTLKPGEKFMYTFVAQVVGENKGEPFYICAEARLPANELGAGLTSNQHCNLVTKKFTVFTPYPVPVKDLLQTSYLQPEDGAITITLYDLMGRSVLTKEDTRTAGVYRDEFSLKYLTPGLYYLRWSFKGLTEVRKIVVQ